MRILEGFNEYDDMHGAPSSTLYISKVIKPYITEDDLKFFGRLNIDTIGYFNGAEHNFVILNMGYYLTTSLYNHRRFGLNSVLLRSLNIRFMKISKREGNLIGEDPWRKVL